MERMFSVCGSSRFRPRHLNLSGIYHFIPGGDEEQKEIDRDGEGRQLIPCGVTRFRMSPHQSQHAEQADTELRRLGHPQPDRLLSALPRSS